jgi:dienelactone hydrolase
VLTPARASTPAVTAPQRAHILLIHGGSWYRVGPRAVARVAAAAPRLRSWGYVTHVVRYRARRRAFPDVLAAYDRLRRRVGVSTPICAYGSSAGAQMALMLAIRRPAVACVISQAAPTELERLPQSLRRRARDAFGRHLARWSPASYRLLTPALLEQADTDRVVPFRELGAMHRAAPHSRTLALAAGSAPWIHARVDSAQLAHSHAVERAFLRDAVARWRAAQPATAASAASASAVSRAAVAGGSGGSP